MPQNQGYQDFLKFMMGLQQAMGQFGGERPATPTFPTGGLSEAEESAIFKQFEDVTGRATNKNLSRVDTAFGGRGAFRSGARNRAVADVIEGGQSDLANMTSNYLQGKAGRLHQSNLAEAQFDLSKWQQLLKEFGSTQEGVGQTFGSFYRR